MRSASLLRRRRRQRWRSRVRRHLAGVPEERARDSTRRRLRRLVSQDEKSTAGYTFDHTSIIYLMDPNGAYVTHFSHTTSVDTLAERLAKVL